MGGYNEQKATPIIVPGVRQKMLLIRVWPAHGYAPGCRPAGCGAGETIQAAGGGRMKTCALRATEEHCAQKVRTITSCGKFTHKG